MYMDISRYIHISSDAIIKSNPIFLARQVMIGLNTCHHANKAMLKVNNHCVHCLAR